MFLVFVGRSGNFLLSFKIIYYRKSVNVNVCLSHLLLWLEIKDEVVIFPSIQNNLPQEVGIRRRMVIAFTVVIESTDEVVLFLSIQNYVLQEACIRRRMGSRIQLLVTHAYCFRG